MGLMFERIKRKHVVKLMVGLFMLFGFMAYFIQDDKARMKKDDKVQMTKNDREEKVTEPSFVPIERRYPFSQLIPDDPLNRCLKHKNITLTFSQLMSVLNIETVLIEPSVIFCLLSPKQKAQLQEKAFNITDYQQAGKITRFALFGKNVEALAKFKTYSFLKTRGFYYEGAIDNFDDAKNSMIQDYSITHYFFKSNGEIIHAVTLRERGNFFWLSKIPYVPQFLNLSPKDFPFYEHDTAYERFPRQQLNTTAGATLVVPQDPVLFLHQLSSAKFLECDLSRAKDLPEKNPKVPNKKLQIGFINALQQLKANLQPRLTNFFLMGGTLLGWFRQCGMIPHTTDIDFGAWGTDAGDVDYWIKTFRGHPKLRIVLTMGLSEEAFELRFRSISESVDLFFLYKEGNTTWTSGHVHWKGYYFRYTYPMFTLCSAELLRHKVLVPCETLPVILADYGPGWNKPEPDWHYEVNPKNMGPHIQWPKDKLDKIYREI